MLQRLRPMVWLTVMALGCASTRTLSIRSEGESTPELAQLRKGIEVVGYTTHDGVHHSVEATVELLDDGSWRFRPHGYGRAPFTMGKGEVERLEVRESTSVGKLVVLAVVIGFLSYLALALVWASADSTP
jgi:hypothetical protein